jgi:tetratricopeptide (TPR) repeat protein
MRIARPTLAGVIVFCFVLLVGSLCGQDTEWDRSIQSGDAAMAKQHFAEAEAAYRGALALAEQQWQKDARISRSMLKLAESCNAQGKQEEAETLARRSSALMEEVFSSHKPEDSSNEYQQILVCTSLFDKAGDVFVSNHHFEDAESMYENSLGRWQEYVFRTDPNSSSEDSFRFLIRAQQNTSERYMREGIKLAALYQRDGKANEAKALYRKLASSAKELYEANDPRMVPSLTSIATSEFRLGDYGAAEPLFKRVIHVLEASEYKDSADMASALEN